MGILRRSLAEEKVETTLGPRPRTTTRCAEGAGQNELPLKHEPTPGPLFGPLPIRRPSANTRRAKLYRKKLKQATPPWADKVAIRLLYARAKQLTAETGVRYSVDHDIPLRGEFVWGLHVHYNLVVVPLEYNMRKGNAVVDQPVLF